jgi:SAM-dependent methyltransferase
MAKPDPPTPPATRYSASHLDRGHDYDDGIASDPFSHYMDRIEQALLRRLIPRLFPGGLDSSLDFACGTGRITRVVAEFAARSYGVDVSETMLAQARRKSPRTEFHLHDLTAKDLDLPPVSLVTSFRFFGNAEQPLRAAVLAALSRRLSRGGYLIINNHRNPWSVVDVFRRLRGGAPELDLHYPKLARLLRDNGFRVVRVYAIGTWLIRHRMFRTSLMESKTARVLEALTGLGVLARFAPDMVIVARRV